MNIVKNPECFKLYRKIALLLFTIGFSCLLVPNLSEAILISVYYEGNVTSSSGFEGIYDISNESTFKGRILFYSDYGVGPGKLYLQSVKLLIDNKYVFRDFAPCGGWLEAWHPQDAIIGDMIFRKEGSWDYVDYGDEAWADMVIRLNTSSDLVFPFNNSPVFELSQFDSSSFTLRHHVWNSDTLVQDNLVVHGDLTSLIATPVPEPVTMLLLGSGIIGLAGISRKKFKK